MGSRYMYVLKALQVIILTFYLENFIKTEWYGTTYPQGNSPLNLSCHSQSYLLYSCQLPTLDYFEASPMHHIISSIDISS